MAQEDDRKDDQPANAPLPAGGDNRRRDDDIFDDVTDDVGGIIISGVRPGASFPKKPTADEPEIHDARREGEGDRT